MKLSAHTCYIILKIKLFTESGHWTPINTNCHRSLPHNFILVFLLFFFFYLKETWRFQLHCAWARTPPPLQPIYFLSTFHVWYLTRNFFSTVFFFYWFILIPCLPCVLSPRSRFHSCWWSENRITWPILDTMYLNCFS